ncbi:hypothetical protein L1987_53877 [Smallanthus sonchifolius]|uniref:Uncharacterized protein n=1 Tax=Smallanthus sonchifolius TaxID=185202 RepID=A0ACB9EWF2_9ASTR|nr:hypothetical protein L1987_53877 [Smallanthus sonchifolius]
MAKKKEPPPPSSALQSRRSTRNANRSASVGEGFDIEAPTGSVVGLGSNQETATRVFEPIAMEKDSERVSGSRPIQRNTRSEMMLKPDLWSETDACMVNKEQSSISGSNDLSESSSTSVNVLDKSMDKIGDSPPVPQSDVSAGKLMAGKAWSAGSVASSGKATSTGVGVLNDADVFPIQTPLFSSSFKEKMMESIGRASAGKPGFAGVTGFAGSGTPHSSQPPHTRVAVVGESTGTVVGPGIGVTGLEVRAGQNSDGPGIAATGEASPDSGTGPEMRAPGYVTGFVPGPALDGPIEPVVGSFTLDTNHEAMHAMGLSPEPGERTTSETMQVDCHQGIIQLNEVEVVPNLGHGLKQEGDHSRQNPFSDNEVLDRNPWKCGVFGHNEDIHNPPPPPPQPRVVDPIAEPRVEPRVVDPVYVDPQIERTKGKGIMADGFIKVTKKKKKNNGPKPRVQIPSLHVSKPGPSKPLGRARPNVITRVTVSNPFEALDDVNQIDDGFPELNATLKKFSMRYVKENTIPDPDVFKTWSTDLKEYYYSLIKDDGEEVESETDGTAKMMSTGNTRKQGSSGTGNRLHGSPSGNRLNSAEDIDLVDAPELRQDADDTIMGENCVQNTDHAGRGENLNLVLLKKEYTGDSILDNLSKVDTHLNIQNTVEEGETEVNFDKSDKTRSCLDTGMTVEGKSLNEELVNTAYNMHVTGQDEWEIFCMRPRGVKWPENWCQSSERDLENETWDQVLDRVNGAWNGINSMENSEGYQRLKQTLSHHAGDNIPIFFEKHNPIVECLAKWLGRHTLNDHDAWRKIKEPAGRPSRWLDIERETCQPEEALHRKKKKKSKSKGMNPFSKVSGNDLLENGVGTTKGEDNRTRHKIWFSRNRKPERNMSLKKITFSQEAIPNTASIHLMGLGNFHAGSDKSKHSQVEVGRKDSHMSKLDALFEDLVARKEKLREIVENINATDANKKLVNSILCMKKFKVLKFSAKLNDDGNVTIDENMVELDNGPETIPVTQAEPPQASYAYKLTGQGGQTDRRSGIRQGQSYKPNGTRQAWAVNQGTNRDKGTNGDFMYSRNIVNKQARQDIPESSRSNGERLKLDNPPQQPIPNEPPLNNVKPHSARQVDNGRKVDREDDQSIRMVETKNRFLLLNEDGDDIDGDRITQDIDQQAKEDQVKGNEGWRKRQERTLNVRFRNLVTQDQRLKDQDNPNMEIDHSDDEVDSEIDGTADLMKTDAPVAISTDLDAGSMLGRLENQPLPDGISSVGKNNSQ